jgi:transcription antitermination factor NusG
VIYVRPRREKKVGYFCEVMKIPHYLPLRCDTRIYQRRKVSFLKPVFPGYLFAALDDASRAEVFKTNNVIRLLKSENQNGLLFELEQIKMALTADPTLGACAALTRGRHVRITGGAFMGIEGIVYSFKNPSKVCLNVEMINRAVAVEVDKDLLEVIE